MSAANRLKKLSRWLAENMPEARKPVVDAVLKTGRDGDERYLLQAAGEPLPRVSKRGDASSVQLNTAQLWDATNRYPNPGYFLDFHTHPPNTYGLSGVNPSPQDLAFWSNPNRYSTTARDSLTHYMIASPPVRSGAVDRRWRDRPPGFDQRRAFREVSDAEPLVGMYESTPAAYMSYTVPVREMLRNELLTPMRFGAARNELGLAARKGRFGNFERMLKSELGMRDFDARSELYDLLERAAPAALMRYDDTMGRAVHSGRWPQSRLPYMRDEDVLDALFPEAHEVLRERKFKVGGAV